MKKIWFWVRLGLSISLVGILLFGVDFRDFSSSLARLDPAFFLIALALALADRVVMAYKWNLLLRVKSIDLPLPDVTRIYLTSTFLGLFLPATVGADAVRTYAVSKKGYPVRDIIPSIIIERLLGVVALLVFMLISILISFYTFGQSFYAYFSRIFWIGLALSAALLVLMLVSLNHAMLNGWYARLNRWGQRITDHKIVQKLKEIYQSYQSFRDYKWTLGSFLLLSFVENLFPILGSFYLAMAFGMQVPLLYFFILIPIVLVLVRLPISIDGIGIQESAFVYFFTLLGMLHTEALLLGIATHVLSVMSTLPGGLLYGVGGLGPSSKAVQVARWKDSE